MIDLRSLIEDRIEWEIEVQSQIDNGYDPNALRNAEIKLKECRARLEAALDKLERKSK